MVLAILSDISSRIFRPCVPVSGFSSQAKPFMVSVWPTVAFSRFACGDVPNLRNNIRAYRANFSPARQGSFRAAA